MLLNVFTIVKYMKITDSENYNISSFIANVTKRCWTEKKNCKQILDVFITSSYTIQGTYSFAVQHGYSPWLCWHLYQTFAVNLQKNVELINDSERSTPQTHTHTHTDTLTHTKYMLLSKLLCLQNTSDSVGRNPMQSQPDMQGVDGNTDIGSCPAFRIPETIKP